MLVQGERATNGPAEYLAISFASRDAATVMRLRVSVAEIAPDARVVRSRTGIVTRIEAGGVVTVRFEDGSERRLMLEYAPLERI